MLRPIESLLLLQLGCMIKCHLSRHPLTPTYRFLSISHCLSLCYSGSEPCCLCYLVLFFSPLCQLSFHFFLPFIFLCVLICLSVSPLLFSARLSLFYSPSLTLPHCPLVSPPNPLFPLVSPLALIANRSAVNVSRYCIFFRPLYLMLIFLFSSVTANGQHG